MCLSSFWDKYRFSMFQGVDVCDGFEILASVKFFVFKTTSTCSTCQSIQDTKSHSSLCAMYFQIYSNYACIFSERGASRTPV